MPWDLVVVGAGPAGACAALAALRTRPHARVLLLDRAEFPRDKSCGDGIAPHVEDVLASLGVPGLIDDHRPVRRLHLGYAGGAAVAGDMTRPARVVPRRVLDARLVEAAVAAGAQLQHRRVRRLEVTDDGVRLDDDLVAPVVVAADGARSELRRSIGLPHNGSGHVAVAIRGYATVRPDLADEQRIVLGRGDWPAYAWSFPVGDGTANVGYGEVLRDGRPAPTRDHLLSRLEDLLPDAGHDARDWVAHHLPLSSQRPVPGHGRVLLAGDAASLVNPMTGEGIYYAVLSGACAGAAAVLTPGAAAGRTYSRMLRRRLGRHLRHTTAAAALARRPGVVDAALRGASRDRPTFDALVEIGLGRGLLTPRAALGIAGGTVHL